MLDEVPHFTHCLHCMEVLFSSSDSKNASDCYYQIFSLFPEKLRPEKRRAYKSYDDINNVFNFGYCVLKCKIDKALLKAKLDALYYVSLVGCILESSIQLPDFFSRLEKS